LRSFAAAGPIDRENIDMGIMSDSIQTGIDNKQYEVVFTVRVHARNVGDAIKRAQQILDAGVGNVKDVVEIKV
jgi:hypothetical protein